VRVGTEAGSTVQKLNVSGRWDDTDIVHVMSENLAIAAQPGGSMERLTAPPVVLVMAAAHKDPSATGGSLGSVGTDVKYTYKLTYVDRFGYESPASPGVTTTITSANFVAQQRSVRLAQLPSAADSYVARRLYRSENDGPFVFVAQLNRQDTVFVDSGAKRDGMLLHEPPIGGVALSPQLDGTLEPGTYNYRITYVDAVGKESRASDVSASVVLDGNPTEFALPGHGSVLLERLPVPQASENYVGRRIYRSTDTGTGPYRLVAQIDASSTQFVDDGTTDPNAVLEASIMLGRPEGRLSIDPSIVVKLDGARFEVEMGAQLIAEGDDGREIIFTSIADDRYGAGGTFDTGNDGAVISGSSNDPVAGDWGGIYAAQLANLSIDHAVLAYGGGVTRVEGTFTAFNVVEIHDEAEARIANSVFEFNSRGQGGQGETDRFGRGFNSPGVIFVRQAQPVIHSNVFRNNPDDNPNTRQPNTALATPAININVNALNYVYKRDTGRSTGLLDRLDGYRDNQGPLILHNQLDDNEINGMVVRGQTLTTQSVWDDTDIVHVLFSTVYVSDFHSYGGLMLASSPTESLVVKLLGNAGFVATGVPHETEDRIGGIIQILGQPGSPVVLTSFRDDRYAAGTRPDGNPQGDTNNDGSFSTAQAGDWTSIRLDRYSHDRNVETLYESEARDVNSPGPNGSPDEAQLLGILGPREHASDENLRLGFTVKGFLTDSEDLDVYSFKAIPNTEVWIDLDRTTMAFDPIIELLDSDGQVVARSISSLREELNPDNYLEPLQRDGENLTARQLADPSLLAGEGRLMDKTPQTPGRDFYSANPRDPGLRVLLPGVPNPEDPDRPLTYHVRIRSNGSNLDDSSGGLTSGAYQLQIRLRELDEIGGSTVRYATIAYATNGVEIYGQPAHSPLGGEATEDTSQNETSPNAQRLGNLVSADRGVISVGGVLDSWEDGDLSTPDVDFYEFDIAFLDPNVIPQYPILTYPTVFDIDYANGAGDRPNTSLQVYRLYDMNGTPNDRTDDVYRLVYTARDGNLAEDRPATPGSSDIEDLLRGTVGATDPFLGIVDLAIVQPTGEPFKPYPYATYRVAVSSDVWMPDEMNQFTSANAANPDLRLEPIQTVRRIAEDHIDFGNNSTADPPQIPVLWDDESIVPYQLGDVVLYLVRDEGIAGDSTSTTVLTVDPFSGAQETLVGRFGDEIGDVAMHPNGWLYSYRLSRGDFENPYPTCYPRDDASGNFLSINPGDASRVRIRDDGIGTYREDLPDNPDESIETHYCDPPGNELGDGIEFNAITFFGNQDGLAVGDRGFAIYPDSNLIAGVEIIENILYRFVGDQMSPDFGRAASNPQPNKTADTATEKIFEGAGTDIRERGEVLTAPRLEATYATGSRLQPPNQDPALAQSDIEDGQYFSVVDGANQVTFEFDTGPEILQSIDVQNNVSIRDGNFFQLDDNLFQIDTGSVIDVFGSGAAVDGVVVTVNDGRFSESFEFRWDRGNATPPRTDPNATVIAVGAGTTPLQIASDLAEAINAGNLNITAHAPGSRVSMEGDSAVSVSLGASGIRVRGMAGPAPILQAVDGSQIKDGDNFYLNSSSGYQTFEFDTGYTLVTPVRYLLQMPVLGGRAVADGEKFTIGNSVTGENLTFEFDRDGRASVPPAQVISYSASDSADQLADKVVAVIGNPAFALNLEPTAQTGGVVHLGSTQDHSLNASAAPSLQQRGVAGGITEGETFTIRDGFRTIVFEMDSDGTVGDPANVPIAFSQVATHDQIAANIMTAIQAQPLGLTPTYLGNGQIHLGGDDGVPAGSRNHTLDTTTAANISDTGRPGVSDPNAAPIDFVIPGPSFTATQVVNRIDVAIQQASANKQIEQALPGNQLWDGRTFAVVSHGRTYTFEYDDVRNGPAGVALGHYRIAFDPGDANANPAIPATTAAVMATRIENAIEAAIPAAQLNRNLVNVGVRDRVVIQEYAVDLTTQQVGDRIVVNGDNIGFLVGTSAIKDLRDVLGFTLIGNVEESYDVLANDARFVDSVTGVSFLPQDYTVWPANRNMTDHLIATRVAAVVGAHPDYSASGAGGFLDRINFPDALAADFAGMRTPGLPQVWNQVTTSASGVSSGNIRIPVLANDGPLNYAVDRNLDRRQDGTQTGLANKLANAIDAALNNPFGIDAAARGKYVRLNRGSVINVSSIIAKGEGPGGRITGLATVNGSVYAVSNQGGLYRIDDPFNVRGSVDNDDVETRYIGTSRDDLLGIGFSGLTAGPSSVESQAYRNMLFATDSAGTLYAFNTAGELQPVFVNGATSVSTGTHATEIRGLAFSTLDENLFQYTPGGNQYLNTASGTLPVVRQYPDPMDFRVGTYSPTSSPANPDIGVYYQQREPGHENYQTAFGTQSIHFGKGVAYDLNGNRLGVRSYEYPGGAQGSIVSNEFSLNGYAAADRPALYFSYFLDTENDSSAPPEVMMRDAVRVYISDNNGDWQELATNNSRRTLGIFDDELIDLDAAYRGATAPDDAVQYFDVQELYDADDWRQVRIPLDQYAGRTNLRLRVDFSTAGDFNVGDVWTGGEEVRAVSGFYIQDGDTAQIGGLTLEFDSGLTIVAPTGAAIPVNEEMTLTDELGNTAIVRFVNNTLTSSDMVVTDGSHLFDGEVFYLHDGTTTRGFEFDSGYILAVPAQGGAGIADMETFLVDWDGLQDNDADGVDDNPAVAFEFDKNGLYIDVDGVPGRDNRIVNIADNLTIVVPAGGGGSITDGETMRLTDGTTSYTLEFDKDNSLVNPFANLRINAAANRTIQLPAAGGGVGGVQDGDIVRIDPDGLGAVPPVVFEFDNNGLAGAANVMHFDHFTTQDVLADRLAAAINARAGVLGLNAKNLGGGIVVLDDTTPQTVLDTSAATNVGNGFRPPTQEEMAERIVAALDGADGNADGQVLGLTLPVAAGEIVNGAIVLGGTQPSHVLNTRGLPGVSQTLTPRAADEVAERMADAINAAFGTTALRAAALGSGMLTVLDAAGGVIHTVDVTGSPGLTLSGVPGTDPRNVAVPFFPTDTVDQMIYGGGAVVVDPPLVAGARPGLASVINTSGLNVSATPLAFPNDNVIALDGTLTPANTVTFSPGVTALRPRDIISIYVDQQQTPNDVAERIFLGIQDAVDRGQLSTRVVPHMNADLGYDNPAVRPSDYRSNLINVEGLRSVTFSSGAASAIVVQGATQWNDASATDRALVPFHSDMTRVQVADELDRVLEQLFHNPTLITETGINYADGQTFLLEDGVHAPVIYEFDSGFVLQIPPGGGSVADGGIEDGETITITDSSGTISATFEFDKDGSLTLPPGTSTRVAIRETDSALSIARTLTQALQAHPLRTSLGLTPQQLSGNRVQVGGGRGAQLKLSPGSAVTLEDAQPGTSPAVTLQLPQTLAMQLPDPLTIHVPPAGIVDGEAFTLSDGRNSVTFEFENIFFANGVAAGNRAVLFAPTDTAEDIGRALVNEIASSGLFVEPTMLGGTGNIDLGGGSRFSLQVPAAAPNSLILLAPLSLQVPAGGGGEVVDGDYFTITQGANQYVFEFENLVAVPGGDGPSRIGSNLIGYDPADTREQLADKIAAALTGVPGLALTAFHAGDGIIHLTAPAATSVTLPPVANHLFQTGPLSLQAPTRGGVEVADGDYFTVIDGSTRFLFEFEDVATVPGGNGASLVNSFLINFNPADTQDQLADRIITRLQAVAGLNLLPEKTAGDVRVHLGAVAYDTSAFTSVTLDTSRTHLAQTGRSDALVDGQRLFVTNGTTVATLELDLDGSVRPGSVAIDVAAGSTPHQIAGEIILEIERAALGVSPRDLGDGLIHVGGTAAHDLDTASIPAITKLGVGGAIPDGLAFYVTEGAVTKRFEYDKDGVVTPGSVAIGDLVGQRLDDMSLDEIALATVARMSPGSSFLGIVPSYLGDGLIDLGGNDENDVLTVSTSLLVDPSLPALQFRVPQRGAAAAVIDGETFTVTNRTTGANYVFEYDNDGSTVAGRIAVPFSATDARNDVANAVVNRVRANVPGLTPRHLGDGVVDLNANPAVFALTLALRVPQPGGGAGGVIDQETITVRDLATGTDRVFEFDNNGAVQSGHVAIPFTSGSTQNEVARNLVTVLSQNVPGLTAVNLGDGIVNLGGNLEDLALVFEPGLPLVASGLRGAQTPHVRVIFAPSDDFTGNDVGTAIINAVNGTLNLDIHASVGAVGTADQRRVELTHTSGFPWDIQFTTGLSSVLRLEAPQNIVKQHEDLLRIVGHAVVDPGPLGYEALVPLADDMADNNPVPMRLGTHLPGDAMGGFDSAARGQNNRYEGLYLDDFIIGFAERGEAVSSAVLSGNSAFVSNPDGQGHTEGEYQLEIRSASDGSSVLRAIGSFDTNDRLGAGQTMVIQRGLDIADGQIFTLSDGVQHVVFEYLDTSIPNNQPEPGRIGIPFTPADADYAIAQRVRDAINGPDAQAVLDVTAAIADGTLIGRGSPMYSTSARVNLFGPVTLYVHATDVEEVNDSLATATPTGIVGIDSPSFLGHGYIGDNENFPLRRGLDVDLFRVDLTSGATLRIDLDAFEVGSELDAHVRIFDAAGNPAINALTGLPAVSDDAVGPLEFARLDPFLEFVPLRSGTYYIGVSGNGWRNGKYNADDNIAYDPTVVGSGVESGTTGFYQIEVSFGRSTHTDLIRYDEKGDSNLFRDQGQILIQGNTITDSLEYGIRAEAGARSGQDGDLPHLGPVRMTPKLNADNLVPGVVVANNVLAYNQNGGIRFAGDANPAAVQTAAVPFGRIVNNTIYGGVQPNAETAAVDVVFMIATSAGMGNDIVELRQQLQVFENQMLAANVDANYGLVTFPDSNPNSAPQQIQDLVPFTTFTAAGSAFNSFPTAGATEYGSLAVQEALNAFDPATNFTFRVGSQILLILVTDEDDDSLTTDVSTSLLALQNADATFFGIAQDPNSPFAGNTAQTYGEFARQTGGALFDINAFRQSPGTFFSSFSQSVVSTLSGGLGIGINVEDNAAPTLLNNIVAGTSVGIRVDLSSEAAGTVVGGTLYQGNQTNLNATFLNEDFAMYLDTADPLFRDVASRNFYLAALSPAIDSSVGSLLERFDIKQVKNTLGIADSPILAPETDLTGQLRVDDPAIETPSGFGEYVFVDRGALDRSDFVGPTATSVSPRDNDADGLDANPAAAVLEFDTSAAYSSFSIRLVDGVPPADPNLGSGLQDTTVVSSNVILKRDGVPLVDGIDYTFSYNATSDTIVLTPLSGIWEPNRAYTVELNNTDHFRVVAKPGPELPDGYAFVVLDPTGLSQKFEIDSGYTLSVPQPFTLTVPAAGGSLGGISDGASFTVRRTIPGTAVKTAVFEFDSNGVWTDNNADRIPDNYVVNFNVASTPEEIAAAMVEQLIFADIGLSPKHVAEGVIHLGSTAAHSVDVTRAPNLKLSGQASGIVDGDSFFVDDGTKIVTFEFDNDGQYLDANADGVADNPGATLIALKASDTNAEIAARIGAEIELAKLGLDAVPIGDGQVHLGGVPYVHIVDVTRSHLTLSGEPGVSSAFGLRIPSRAGDPRLYDDGSGTVYLKDGDKFTINDGTRTVTFEMDDLDDPAGGGLTTAPNIVVAYHSSRWGLQIPTNANGTPRVINDGSGDPYLADAQTFTLYDGTRTVTFEFDDVARNPGVLFGNVAVPFRSDTSTTNDIAAALVEAVRSSALEGLDPVNQGRGIVTLGEALASASPYAADTTRAGLRTVGEPGVNSATLDNLANVIVAAIRTAPLSGLKPVNAGLGVVLLGEPTDGTSRHSLDVSQSGLGKLGAAGTSAAVPVPTRLYTEDFTRPLEEQLVPFDGTQVAVEIIRAIAGSGLAVTALPAGGDVVLIQDALQVTELNPVFVSNERRLAIKDQAGNPLKANLLSGDTQMTIVVGDVNLDFGDAPQTAGGHYPTTLGLNGAVHVVTEPSLYLGRRVDAERDGQVSANVDGDNQDSIGFAVDTSGTVHVTVSAAQTPAVLQLPQPLTLLVSDGITLKDGAIFSVTNNGRTVAFEYDSDSPPDLGSVGSTRIAFAATDTVDQVAAATVAALAANPDLGLLPSFAGEGAVHLGSDGVSVLPGRGLSEAGIPNPIADGETFFLEVPSAGGAVRYTFEFENSQLNDGVAKGNLPVLFDKSTSQDGYVQAVRTAVLNARLGIAATDLGSGQLELSGDDEDGVVMGAFNRNTATEVIVTASAV